MDGQSKDLLSCRIKLVGVLCGVMLCVTATVLVLSAARNMPTSSVAHAAPRDALTATVFLPLVLRALPTYTVRFELVGYKTNNDNLYEHMHVCETAQAQTSIGGWSVVSAWTSDRFTFPPTATTYLCSARPATTLNTHITGFEDNVTYFTWGKPLEKDEWPDTIGVSFVGYLYDQDNYLVDTCQYTPTLGDNGNASCH